jgi:hypothetical protein
VEKKTLKVVCQTALSINKEPGRLPLPTGLDTTLKVEKTLKVVCRTALSKKEPGRLLLPTGLETMLKVVRRTAL